MPLEKGSLDSIAKHVKVLNHELGTVQKDVTKLKTSMKWSTRIIGYMAALLTLMTGQAILF